MNKIKSPVSFVQNIMTISFLMILTASTIIGQETAVASTPYRWLEEAKELYHQNVFGIAKEKIESHLEIQKLPHRKDYNRFIKEALLYKHLCDLHMEISNSEDQIQEFIDEYYPQPITQKALFHLGDYHYNHLNYDQAVESYSLVSESGLSDAQKSEMYFKKGYSQFVKKRFAAAQNTLSQIVDTRNSFFYPSNYYYGMTQYFLGDYEDAIRSFQLVSNAQEYKNLTPYYITQIHFARENYDEVISYASSKIHEDQVRNQNRIHLLLGQAYFQKGMYEKALPHLEFYESNTDKISKEEFYQIAFAQYRNQRYEEAISNFQEIAGVDDKMGQLVNYYLAESYLKTNDLVSARSAFKAVSQQSFDKSMQEEALFNFAKLSAQEGYDREAITAFSTMPISNPFYSESQSILANLFLRTKDYKSALSTLEGMGQLTPALKGTYQKVSFYQGIQEFNDDKLEVSKGLFEKSLIYPTDKNISAQAHFWLANYYQQKNDYKKSNLYYNDYFNLADGTLTGASSMPVAHYNVAYNYLGQKDYDNALTHFEQSVLGLRNQKASIKESIFTDALVRSGDSYFKKSKYKKALVYYDEAVGRNKGQSVYALFQKGIIEGLSGDPYGKIISLEEIIKTYPTSSYADDALLHLGDTYTQLSNTQEAFDAYNKLVKNYKNNSPLVNEAYLKMGLSSYNQGDLPTSVRFYKNIFLNNPSSKERTEALSALEEIYIQDLGQSDEYFAFLESIPNFKLSDYSKDSLSFTIAQVQFENGQYDKAILSFGDYIDKYGKGNFILDAHYNRAQSHYYRKTYKEALPDYEFVINTGFSDYYEKSLYKAALISYNYAEEFPRALGHYKQLEAFTADPALKYEALIGAMESAYRGNEKSEASVFAGKVQADPLVTTADKSKALYYLGKASYDDGKIDQAIFAFNQLVREYKNEHSAEASYLISKIFFDKGDLDKAELQCKTTNTTSLGYPFWVAKSLLLMTDIYIKKDDLYNARAASEAVLENFQDNPEISQEAQTKLDAITELEKSKNRILEENEDGTLQLDKGND